MTEPLKILLVDRDAGMCAAWRKYFSGFRDVEIRNEGIFNAVKRADAIVSPANSFGFMDGGIDAAYTEKFGPDMSFRLRVIISDLPNRELLVGQCLGISTQDGDFPVLISAPTMRIPCRINDSVNVFLAFRAALQGIKLNNEGMHGLGRGIPDMRISSVLCPGLGTGAMPHEVAAKQMRFAYDEVIGDQTYLPDSLGDAVERQWGMMRWK